ncbi:glycoside hydrolase family 16 protein [Aspergillus alliaceus]|uniref:glycoside hydrolase family 16 protein n=1 Tax=Petromyces alliaceus TaxID=209559 RepID=UPI0012A4A02D|nr:concanavalin A-like lectin/glucanase domain-containing protein [Aspergillus alliaceus]KAB8238562.1 concanavalin A-like lectin/glucanase domain-containing protein [Aspergillus alliaceus]
MALASILKLSAIAVALGAQLGAAQTYTSCNPMEKTCPADVGLANSTLTTGFTSGESAFKYWNTTSGTVSSTSLGAEFSIKKQGDAPTIESKFYIFFGYVEMKMRAANGTGIVSTLVIESDDLDEIDWEQVSSYDNQIQTNYFGKGNTTSYDRATTVTVSTPDEIFHTYAINWTSSKIEWVVDGSVVRTLNYADALDGENFPQTPSRIKIGIWAGGDPDNSEGTIEWAGGETDYDDSPFTMYVESVKVINYNPARSYTYTDKTGAFTSIKASNVSTASNSSTSTTSLFRTNTKSSTNSSTSSSVSIASSTAFSGASTVLSSSFGSLFVGSIVTITTGMLGI